MRPGRIWGGMTDVNDYMRMLARLLAGGRMTDDGLIPVERGVVMTAGRWKAWRTDPWAGYRVFGVVDGTGRLETHTPLRDGGEDVRSAGLDDLAGCRPLLEALNGGDPTPLLDPLPGMRLSRPGTAIHVTASDCWLDRTATRRLIAQLDFLTGR